MLVSDILLSITLFQIFLRRLFWVFLCELLRNPLRIFLFDLFNCLKSSLLGDLRLLVHSTLGFKLIRSFLFFCLFVVAGWRLDIHFLLAFFKMLIFFFLLIGKMVWDLAGCSEFLQNLYSSLIMTSFSLNLIIVTFSRELLICLQTLLLMQILSSLTEFLTSVRIWF